MPVNPSRIAATPRKPVSADDDTNYPQNRAESREPDLCNCGAESLEILLPVIKALRQRVEALEADIRAETVLDRRYLSAADAVAIQAAFRRLDRR